ncbi:MAG: DUF4912 domain-containing protein [Clostridia bacterium]|nr:DUF4912 domain-containing protein [Clostridia bacterium]
MPRKAKEKIDENGKNSRKKVSSEKVSSVKKAEKSIGTVEKKSTISTKGISSKKSSSKTNSTNRTASALKTDSSRSNATKKTATTSRKNSSKAGVAQKSTATPKKVYSETSSLQKTANKKSNSKKSNRQNRNIEPLVEYYDLPFKYGNTLIRLLAQTPNTLFVYWEISDSDIENFKNLYGDDFFFKTKPILIVHNLTLDKHYEVEINDFANCWYLNTEDSDCRFDVELARKLILPSSSNYSANSYGFKNASIPEYVSIATSNALQSPNDHVLLEKLKEFVVFKNVKTGEVIKKNIKSFKFLENTYKFYKEMYNEEIEKNPSSQFKF